MKRTIWALASAVIFAVGLACDAYAQAQAPAAPPAAGAAVTPGGPGARGGGRGGGPAGPPQPVPPEVAIQRPTAAEVAQMNAEITRLLNANTSAAKPLLDKYRALTIV